MRTLVEVVLRAILGVAAFILLVGTTEHLGWIDGSATLPPLFAIGNWDAMGVVAKLALGLAAASAFVFAVVALPSPRRERIVRWANLGYLLGIAGVIATLLIGGILGEHVRESGSFDWGAGLWFALLGYAAGATVCFMIARE